MLIGKRMNEALNAHIGREYNAFYEYTAMAAWFDEQSLDGFAGFFYKQAEEESEHGLKMVKYVAEVGGHVEIPALPAPKHTFSAPIEALEMFVKMEVEVTRAIYELVELARTEGDHSAFQFLQWYVEEQREEVSSAQALLDRARQFGDERIALLDSTLG